MPLTVTVDQFKDGRRYVRTLLEGVVSAEDARPIATRMSLGGDLRGTSLLCVMAPKAELASEARKVFAAISGADDEEKSKIAVVAQSAPVRVTLSFVLRIAGMSEHTKFFSKEAEAVSWLETASATAKQ